MTEYENTILGNFVVCGIHPNTIWKNLLTNELADYKPDVLFSYPERKELQEGLLRQIMPMSTKLLMERPEESGIERYLLTNDMGETIYAYWKVVYEEITEEFLYDAYEIRNVPLAKKGQPRKVSLDSEQSFGIEAEQENKSWPNKRYGSIRGGGSTTTARDWLKKGIEPVIHKKGNSPSKLKKGTVSFTPMSQVASMGNFPRKESGNFCLDEMDLAGTAYKRTTRRARKKSSLRDPTYTPSSPKLKQSTFVPIAVCIKTANPSSEQAENLLNSLIATLFKHEGNYVSDLHNMIYSFAEFCSHVLTLTQVTTPPPFTELIVPMWNKEIVYYEGLIGNLPCEGDMSIAQLFSLVYTDYIITLWTALLLDKDIIIYTSDPNLYFYIMKSLMHLMFPLNWHFSKGIIPTLEYLSSPAPYCFGVLKSSFSNKAAVLEVLAEEEMQYIMLDIGQEGNQTLQLVMKEIVVYPRECRLKQELEKCCAKYGITRRGILPTKESRYVEFAKQVQEIFFNEVAGLLKGFDLALMKDKHKEIETFRAEFLKIYKAPGIKPTKKDEAKFIQEFIDKQCVAFLYDEAIQEKQSNYARVEAMNIMGKSPPIELLRIVLCSSPSIVLSRLNRLLKAVKKEQKEKVKHEEEEGTAIPLKDKFDWEKEVNRMKMTGAILERSGEFRASIFKQSGKGTRHSRCSIGHPRSSSSESSGSSPNRHKREAIAEDIVMNVEELKEGNPYGFSVLYPLESSPDKKPPQPKATTTGNDKKKLKGTLFYGRKGILAFLNEFMEPEKTRKIGLVEEERSILEHLRNSMSYTRASSGGIPLSGNARDGSNNNMNDDSDSAYSEGSVVENSPVPVISELVGSLIDMKDSSRVSSFLNRDVQFMYFTSTSCLQFYLFLAFFYSKYDSDPSTTVKAYLDAFKYVQNSRTYTSYFPINSFKAVISKLSLEELRKLLASPSELTSVIRTVYEKKLQEYECYKRITGSHPAKAHIKKPLKDDPSSCPTPKKPSKMNKEELKSIKKDLIGELKRYPYNESTISQDNRSGSSSDNPTPYLNNYKKLFKVVDPNPNTIVSCALKDLILLLNVHKDKKEKMFIATSKSPHFEVIDKQAAVLKSKHFFEINKKEPAEGKNNWLRTEQELLAFFLNLHNFMILFALCKAPPAKFPKTAQEWINYSKFVTLKVGRFVFSALEIQHAILRATMNPPKIFSICQDQPYPIFNLGDPKAKFKYPKPNPLINFGLYFPYKSSPQLRVYTPENVMLQLKQTAERYLAGGKLAGSKGQLQLPPMMEIYEEDFYPSRTKEELIAFVKNNLPGPIASKHTKLFSSCKDYPIVYEKFCYDFEFNPATK